MTLPYWEGGWLGTDRMMMMMMDATKEVKERKINIAKPFEKELVSVGRGC